MTSASPAMIPLAEEADRALACLAPSTGSAAIAALDGATLLGERAALAGMTIPGRTSAGGGCRLFEVSGDVVALNLARPADRDLLPALFEDGDLDPRDDGAIARAAARTDGPALVARGRSIGLAIASVHEGLAPPPEPWTEITAGPPRIGPRGHAPRVLDLSALWAGPLAGQLLRLAGCEVVKLESRTRPDAMRAGPSGFFDLLNQGKASVALDFHDGDDRLALLELIEGADIVIEASRPRALAQLGIDADRIAGERPGLVWLTLTGHGARGEASGWVGFGDDCGVAGGLSAALLAASGHVGFVGDAIADPLTGVQAALCAWTHWRAGRGGRFGLAMSGVVAHGLEQARTRDPGRLRRELAAWADAAGQRFPRPARRPSIPARPLGADSPRWRPRPC